MLLNFVKGCPSCKIAIERKVRFLSVSDSCSDKHMDPKGNCKFSFQKQKIVTVCEAKLDKNSLN